MPLAARVGDLTAHPGTVGGPGAPTVLIGGQPAARVGDVHTCALPPPAGPHPPNPVSTASSTVTICGLLAARLGDLTGCGAAIVTGSPNVSIGG